MSRIRNIPLHERYKAIGWLRQHIRRGLFHFLQKAAQTDDARATLANTLQGLLRCPPDVSKFVESALCPYPELGKPRLDNLTAYRADPIFITARFRSGSTLLWNIFRHVEGCTAYYEPFNERRWFDLSTRGDQTDPTHRNVSEYWQEYAGLEMLSQYYREDWIRRNLFMDATFWNPDMKRYVEIMIEKAPGRPVLQFNRIDFRLPWFRRNFPEAKIVHLYRHPRDQWCSSLGDPKCFPASGNMADFEICDKYYLRMWASDLKYNFPFLDEKFISHPYQMFYYIWKLSYWFGIEYADYSMSFEDVTNNPEQKLAELFPILSMGKSNIARLKPLIVPQPSEKWKEYAHDDWFRHHEEICETVLAEYLRGSIVLIEHYN